MGSEEKEKREGERTLKLDTVTLKIKWPYGQGKGRQPL